MVYDEHEYPLVRKAVIEDVEPIHEILNAFAAQGKLLPRSLSDLYEHLRAYYVLETVPGERIQGVCGLGICWKDLAETIYANANQEQAQAQGQPGPESDADAPKDDDVVDADFEEVKK